MHGVPDRAGFGVWGPQVLPAPASNPQHPLGLGDQPPRAELLLPPCTMCTIPCDQHSLGLGGVTPLWGCVCHSLVLATSPCSASWGNAAGDRVAPDPAPPAPRGGASPPRAQRCSLGSAARWCPLTRGQGSPGQGRQQLLLWAHGGVGHGPLAGPWAGCMRRWGTCVPGAPSIHLCSKKITLSCTSGLH